MAQYLYGIGLCLVQHSVFSPFNLEKHGTWLLPGKGETNESLQTEVPCRKQIFGNCALEIAISGLPAWIQRALSIWCMRRQCIPGLSRVSGLLVSTLIYLILTVWKPLWCWPHPPNTVPTASSWSHHCPPSRFSVITNLPFIISLSWSLRLVSHAMGLSNCIWPAHYSLV